LQTSKLISRNRDGLFPIEDKKLLRNGNELGGQHLIVCVRF